MNRSRLIQYVAAALVSMPTAYAFIEYAGEAQALGKVKPVESAPVPPAMAHNSQVKSPSSKPEPTPPAEPPKPAEPRAEPQPAEPTVQTPEKTPETVAKADPQPEPTAKEDTSKNTPKDDTEDSSRKKRRKKDEGSTEVAKAETASGEGDDNPKKKRRKKDEDSGDVGQLTLKASETAEVFLDGRKIGVTPVLGHKVAAGVHKVRFDCLHPDGKTRGTDRSVDVLAFSEVSVDYKCVP